MVDIPRHGGARGDGGGSELPRPARQKSPAKGIPATGTTDVPRRKAGARRFPTKYLVYALAGAALIALVTFGLSRLKPAAPSVEKSTVWFGTVRRGQMVREVRGTGTLVPEDVRVIAAATDGRVEQILTQPGVQVGPDTVLLELSNPQLQQEALDVEYQMRAAEADLNNLQVKLESDRLSQQATAATVHSEYQQAKAQYDTDALLAKEGLIPALTLRQSWAKANELANRYQIEQQRLAISTKATQAQTAAQGARIEQFRALHDLKASRLASLKVRAGTAGVLQQLTVEVGQQVTPGTNLARVANPASLKAALKVAETQAKDVQVGQRVAVDTRNGIVPGHVVRIDPAVEQGTVTIDVALDGGLPASARPDMSVDGNIELERLDNVLYVPRPASAQAQGTVSLFKVEPDGKGAVRVQVKLGRASVDTVEVLEGLQEGDQIVLSDTAQWDAVNRIVFN
ncbi:MAG: HlyD family efflux transporter periplasmic adaptor subunit [Acidobacteriota bacterium]|nr:HlyD family efflux transporter periplasmic adaptor subunit [Acidobacteriota bacterium]